MTAPTPTPGPATMDSLHRDVKAVLTALAGIGSGGGGGGGTIDTSTLAKDTSVAALLAKLNAGIAVTNPTAATDVSALAKDATLISVRDALLGGTGKVQTETISSTTPLAWTVTRGDHVNTPDTAVTAWFDPIGAWPNFILPASLDGINFSLFVESEVPDAYGNLTHATILPVVGQVADPVTGDSIDLSQRTGLNRLITLAVQDVTPKRVRLNLSAHAQSSALPATMDPVDVFTADTEKPLWTPATNMVVASSGRATSFYMQSGAFVQPSFDGAHIVIDNSGKMSQPAAGSLSMLSGPLVRYNASGVKTLSFDGSFDTTHLFVYSAMQQYGMMAWTATDGATALRGYLTAYAPAL